MIIRSWRAVAASQEVVDTYHAHLESTTFKEMALLPGHLGACLSKKIIDGQHIVHVMSCWQDMASIEAFSKGPVHKAVVKPWTQDLLISFDEEVEFFDVLASTVSGLHPAV